MSAPPAPLMTTPAAMPSHQRRNRRTTIVAFALTVALLAVAALTLTTGTVTVPLRDIWEVLRGRGEGPSAFVIGTLRLPRLAVGAVVGAAFGAAGAVFQSITRNPLGSPDIIGFNTGAATGALIALLIWHGSMAQVSAGALVGGVATALAVYLLAMKRGVQGYRLILVGIGVAAMLTSANWYLLTRSAVGDAQVAASWIAGSLSGRGVDQLRPLAIAVAVLLPATLACSRSLRILELGDETATALGVRVERARLGAIVVAVGLTAVAVAAAGPVAFIALAAPQIARRLTRRPGPGIGTAALTGAFLLVTADFAAQRLFDPIQLPVGVATGAVGGIYLAWLLTRQWREGRG